MKGRKFSPPPEKLLQITLFLMVIIMSLFLLIPAWPTLAGNMFPEPLPNPLAIPLPTASPQPTSEWWPPFYPVPWSLGENDHFYFIRPIGVDKGSWLNADYRYGVIEFGNEYPHTGIDIAVPIGTPVLAAGPGQVVWVDYGLLYGYPDENDPYGLAVVIKHDFGYKEQPLFTAYAHLSEIEVSKGQLVETGDVIGLSGETGYSTGAHLHFEIH